MTACVFGKEILEYCDLVTGGNRGATLVPFCEICPHLKEYTDEKKEPKAT
jgi:hypothetical protein